MVSSRSSIRAWYALAWFFFFSIGCASAIDSLRIGALSNDNKFPGRDLKKEDEKKEEKKIKTQTASPSPALSAYSTIIPTVFPTESSSVENSSEKQSIEYQVLPFSVRVHGSLSTDEVLSIQAELQDYLLQAFLEEQKQQVEISTDSIELTMIQWVESYIPDEADEGDNESNVVNLNGNRSLSHSQRRDERQRGRDLQSALTASTVSTLVKYETRAFLLFKQEEDDDVIVELYPVVQEIQIKALENTTNLQRYFLDLFASEKLIDSGVDAGLQDPVVLMEVQIDERPSKSLNSEETWKEIESILDPSTNSDASVITENGNVAKGDIEIEYGVKDDIENKNGVNSNTSDQSSNRSNDKIPKWQLAVYIVCAVLVLIGICGITSVTRKKKKGHKRMSEFSKGNGSLSVNNVIKVTNDIDKLDEQNGENNHGSTESNTVSTGNNISFESSNTGYSTASKNFKDDTNDPEISVPGNVEDSPANMEKHSSKNSSSFMSFLQKSFKRKEEEQEADQQDDEGEIDSFGAKLNSYNVTSNDDDDSMMGYSLTSLNRIRYNEQGQQDESLEDLESMSVASSVSDGYNNQVFAGVEKILEQDRNFNNLNQYTAKTALNNQQDPSRSLLGDITIDSSHGESVSKADTFETEDVEVVSISKDDGSIHGDVQSVASAFSSSGIAVNTTKYYGQDEIMMSEMRTTPASSKEFHSVSPILSMRNTETNSINAMIQNARVVDDVASDAPSDERNSAATPSQHTIDHFQHPDAIRNSRLVDNDPAVLTYLVKDIRQSNDGSTDGSTSTVRRQNRLTMEL